ncbi:hypothetical protein H5410_036454, partial [Solanum commersonii]
HRGNGGSRLNYVHIQGSKGFSVKQWRRLVCYNYGAPKCIFILYLEILNRLYTRDRLLKANDD